MGFVLKLGFAVVVLVVGWLFVDLLSLTPALLLAWIGVTATGQASGILNDIVLTSSVLGVGALFIMPLLLAMFGHGGKWFSYVSLRWGKRLALMLGLSFVLYLAGNGVDQVVPAIPWADLALAGLASVVGATIYLAPGLIVRLAGATTLLVAKASSAFLGRIMMVGAKEVALEFKQLPLEHVRNKEEENWESRQLRFQRFAQTLAESRLTVLFRMEFADGFGRLILSVKGRRGIAELEDAVISVARAYLPEFRPAGTKPPTSAWRHRIMIKGVPEPSPDPLGPLARYFVENRYTGEYGVSLKGVRPNPAVRFAARRKQSALAGKAGRQTTTQRLDATSDSETPVDRLSQIELDEAAKELERRAVRRSVVTTVWVGAPNEGVAAGAARVLLGTLSNNRPRSGLRIARRASTLMLPSEAAPYLWIPEMSMGGEVAPSAEFETPPMMGGEIELGEVVVASGKRSQKARIPLDQLTKHVFLTGMTGSGKTTSAFGLLIQLHRLGVPFLVIEPAKSEYRSLLACIPDLQVFTIGDEETAPFRLNIFEPPPDVKIQHHLENLQAVWNASFVSHAPLPYIVPQVFAETYKARGWDVSKNVHGRAITFDDVLVQIERIVSELGYERDVTMDVEAALKVRLRSLSFGGKGPLFGAITSTPLEVVLRRPTVIELKNIQDDEEKAFVAALLLTGIASWVQAQGQSKHLKHFTLIEEAHRLLPNVSTEKGDPETTDPRRRMVEQFGNMLAELRAFGEGLAMVEQIPTKILPDAIKNTVTKVIHRVPAEDDRKVLAGAINATPEQAAVFTALKPGEAVLSVESHPVPVRVEVENVVSKLGVPVGGVSDEDVRRRMTEFYMRHPLPRQAPRTNDIKLREVVDSDIFRDKFEEAYHAWLKLKNEQPLVLLLGLTAQMFTKDETERLVWAYKVLSLASAYYLPLDAKDREKFARLFIKTMERSIRNVRGPR